MDINSIEQAKPVLLKLDKGAFNNLTVVFQDE